MVKHFMYVFFSLVALSSTLTACGLENDQQTDLPRSNIEQILGYKLPPNLSGLKSYNTGFQDHTLLVKFEMPAADFQAFLDSTHYRQPLVEPWSWGSGTPQANPPQVSSWWQPQKAKVLAGTTPEHTLRYLMVDKTNPQTYVIYLEYNY